MKDKLKVGYLVTGRLKSTRLPEKLLLEIKGKTVISHMIDRLKLAKNVDEIIICTSTSKQDRPLGELEKNNNVKCFFGDPDGKESFLPVVFTDDDVVSAVPS